MALDEKGLLRPTYDELLESRILQAQELFGENVDTSETSVLGKFIRLSVYDFAKLWEYLEMVYYARFPNTATGVSLDRLLPFAGITRNPATRAEHEIKFTGIKDYTIPVGFLVGTVDGITFYLVNPVTLDSTGKGTGVVQCTQLGTLGNVTLGSIVEIVNPDASVYSIEHTDIVTTAQDEETDAALRTRFSQTITGAGSSTAVSIRSEIMRVPGVRGCLIVENQELETDSGGRPAHSFECFVYADESLNEDIARAIFEKKPVGIRTFGKVAVEIEDIYGYSHTINFSHTEEITISLKLAVKTDATFPADGVAQIKTALVNYINGLSNGTDVIYTALFAKIHGVQGVRETTSLTMASDGKTFASSNIAITEGQVAVTSADAITIEVSEYEDTDFTTLST